MKTVSDGTITAPDGFLAGATDAGMKTRGGLDLGILYSESLCTVAGMFTTSRVKAAPVIWSLQRIVEKRAQAVVVNAGCANACTGEQGLEDAAEMAGLAAERLELSEEDVLVASTGVIGHRLPMERIAEGVQDIVLSKEGGHDLAKAIMTTDTYPKEVAMSADGRFTIGGIAKGSGMIHPDMGTMLAFLTTDADIESSLLEKSLRRAVDQSFNMVTIDGDTSPNDTVIILANGAAGSVREGSEEEEQFQALLMEACTYLARRIAGDGEGATRLIEVRVEKALNLNDARAAARTIAGSPLVKTAVHGCDPNWGRVIAALGRSGCEFEGAKVDLFLNDICLVRGGMAYTFDEKEVSLLMSGTEVSIHVSLNIGEHVATAWGCDLSAEYVSINSEYTT
jgi:glutamate N-acetyltransferase/amino-acid N-acetyltransferase